MQWWFDFNYISYLNPGFQAHRKNQHWRKKQPVEEDLKSKSQRRWWSWPQWTPPWLTFTRPGRHCHLSSRTEPPTTAHGFCTQILHQNCTTRAAASSSAPSSRGDCSLEINYFSIDRLQIRTHLVWILKSIALSLSIALALYYHEWGSLVHKLCFSYSYPTHDHWPGHSAIQSPISRIH